MKRSVLVVLLLVSLASAEDPKTTKLPFNPFENAKAGDWESLETSLRFEGKKPDGEVPLPKFVTYIIRGADEKEVKLGVEARPKTDPDQDRLSEVLARKEAPGLEELLAIKGKVSGVKVEDGKATVGTKEVAGKKISFTVATEATGAKDETTVFFSKEVPGIGLVSETVTTATRTGGKAITELHLLGYGTKDAVTWGKKAPDK